MASYVILEPPAGNDADAGPVYVRDGFTWQALVFGPLWLAWHRLWLPAIVALAAFLAVNAIAASGCVNPAAGFLSTLVSLFIGLEGAAMRIAGLRRRGFSEAGVVEANTLDEAELRYVYREDGPDASATISPTALPRLADARGNVEPWAPNPALGLLDYPKS